IEDCLKLVDKMKTELPKGLEMEVPMNNNDFLYASIENVVHTLIEAFVLVFVVVYIFLQDFRSTIIPAIAIPVALIGTFFVLNLIGFSLNLITLSALVLAIAIVVDDAIVVVEAVHAKLDQGYRSARRASIDAMNEIAGALISITLVMMLVFIPVSFMPGTSGVFYRQFGLTMAIAIGFSAVNALTLSPALCALFLKPHNSDTKAGERVKEAVKEAAATMGKAYKRRFTLNIHPAITTAFVVATILLMIFKAFSMEHPVLLVIAVFCAIVSLMGIFSPRFHAGFEHGYEALLGKYRSMVRWVCGHKLLAFASVLVSVAVLVWLMARTPSAMVPNEDTGTVFVMVDMPAGTSQERTIAVLEQVDSLMAGIPAIENREMIAGYSFLAGQGATYGTFILKLRNWSERSKQESSDAIIRQLYALTSQNIKDGRVMIFAPPMITGYSVTNGFEMKMQDKTGGDINQFFSVVQGFLAQLNAQPEILQAYT
ncbi:MAG: efflux RND transporter permease subunit, partial [Muribaculaceae bacterium]|nr:efflux RND transporter permease subunit [Muribaculaceae bacterium]